MSPVRMCMEPRCPRQAHYRGRCPIHSKDRERQTHSSPGRMYGTRRWQILRRSVLFRQPLCVECGAIATDVDHILAIEDGGGEWDPENLQALCASCHGRKTAAEVRGRGRVG